MDANGSVGSDVSRMRIECSCGKRMLVAASAAGKRVKCPECGQLVVVREHARSSPREQHSDAPATDGTASGKYRTLLVFPAGLMIGIGIGAGTVWIARQSDGNGQRLVANLNLPTAVSQASSLPVLPKPTGTTESRVIESSVTATQSERVDVAMPSGPAPSPSVTATQPEKARIRKEIFEKAHRAALEFGVSKDRELLTLTNELKAIEHLVDGEPERMLLKLFKVVSAVQLKLSLLEIGKKTTDAGAREYSEMTPDARRAGNKKKTEEWEAIAAISREGGVALESPLILGPEYQALLASLRELDVDAVSETGGVKWIPYLATKQRLQQLETSAMKPINETLGEPGK